MERGLVCHLIKPGIEGIPVLRGDGENGAILLGIIQLGEDGVHSIVQFQLAVAEILHIRLFDAVAFLNGIHMRLRNVRFSIFIFAFQKALIIADSFHHHRKICQLGGAVVNIQTVELHQYIEQIRQNMAAAAARVDDLDLFRGQVGILFADLGQLGLYLRLLLGFFQIIVPLGVLWVTAPGDIGGLFLRRGQQLCFGVRVTLHPQASKAVLHHVPHDPVWGKQLGRRRDILLGDLDIFLEGGKHTVLFLAVVVLI